MAVLPEDPLASAGLEGFRRRFQAGEVTAREATEAYLARIERLNPKLEAFVHVAAEQARRAADGVDGLRAAGTDLGPLMGIPVAVKDLFAVSGMPTHAGSRLDLAEAIGTEGSFIRSLKRAGCIVLGKTRTIEFAAGAQNVSHPTPWNPCDPATRRTPGGSSSGSAVAVAAGLCGFAIGSDTGGSVRVPAALCGVAGLKPSTGLWPLDGCFPLCPAMDTVGLLTASAADAVTAYQALGGGRVAPTPRLAGLRFGVPDSAALCMESAVADRYHAALAELETRGAELVRIDWPDVGERDAIDDIYAKLVATDLLTTIGRERFAAEAERIDPVARARIAAATEVSGTEYVRLDRRRRALAATVRQRLQGLDAVVTPTSPLVPRPVAQVTTQEAASDFVRKALSVSRVANVYDLCAMTVPLPREGEALPAGLHIAAAHGDDARLLSLCLSVERLIGRGPRQEMSSFV